MQVIFANDIRVHLTRFAGNSKKCPSDFQSKVQMLLDGSTRFKLIIMFRCQQWKQYFRSIYKDSRLERWKIMPGWCYVQPIFDYFSGSSHQHVPTVLVLGLLSSPLDMQGNVATCQQLMDNEFTSELTAGYEDNLKVVLNCACRKLINTSKSVHATKHTNSYPNPKRFNV